MIVLVRKIIDSAIRSLNRIFYKSILHRFSLIGGVVVLAIMIITVITRPENTLQNLLSTGSILSVILLSIQLLNSQGITECQFLDSLNKSFFEDKHIVKLYDNLQREYESRNYLIRGIERDWSDNNSVSTAAIVRYLTYFESINIDKRLASINTIDNMFGHRFMLIVTNVAIQDRELFRTYYSYNNIYSLFGSKRSMIRV